MQSPHMVDQEAMTMPQVTFQLGNTTVTVRSRADVFRMTPEERRAWFRERYEAKDPVVVAIAEAVAKVITRPKSTPNS
jgi:hypothetical protein